jgi:hypothetical protein
MNKSDKLTPIAALGDIGIVHYTRDCIGDRWDIAVEELRVEGDGQDQLEAHLAAHAFNTLINSEIQTFMGAVTCDACGERIC